MERIRVMSVKWFSLQMIFSLILSFIYIKLLNIMNIYIYIYIYFMCMCVCVYNYVYHYKILLC